MKLSRRLFALSGAFALALSAGIALAQDKKGAEEEPWKPKTGMAGKDVVWVPNPDEMVEMMLDLAEVTKDDLVIDLGSGDGRNVIAAAKRGARAVGVEYNGKLVTYSRQQAEKAGVADLATFEEGDMFVADVKRASVLILFLLTDNLNKLVPNFLDMNPGSRIVVNTFHITGWEPDITIRADPCTNWCTLFKFYVPAKAQGTWKLDNGTLTLTQKFQMVEGDLLRDGKRTPVRGRLKGEEITLMAGTEVFKGRVKGDRMVGEAAETVAKWSATRTSEK